MKGIAAKRKRTHKDANDFDAQADRFTAEMNSVNLSAQL
jgi:hypothetical protein